MLYAGETQRCFGCHTTASTTNRHFDPSRLIPGVTCEACHGPGAKHVAAMKADKIKNGITVDSRSWPAQPGRSGRFLRRMSPKLRGRGLSKTFGIRNVRFQPYRLERSQCWIKSNNGITCLSCHNPHQSRVRDLASYDDRCLTCHQHPHDKTSATQRSG